MENCPPGTIINDENICKENEFYMISQKSNQGIASPTHYFIMHNDFVKEEMTGEDKKKVYE